MPDNLEDKLAELTDKEQVALLENTGNSLDPEDEELAQPAQEPIKMSKEDKQ